MCKLFIEADKTLWDNHSKSLRMNGMVTSIRLENFFWRILEGIAKRDGMTVNQLIMRLYDEAAEAGHDVDNFTSFLRVCCGRYQALQISGDIPKEETTPIRSLNAEEILNREKHYNGDLTLNSSAKSTKRNNSPISHENSPHRAY